MLRNIVFVVITAMLAALFIWAPHYAGTTSDLLDNAAKKAIDFSKNEKWEECGMALQELDNVLSERKAGLKILFDHEEVDNLMKSAAIAKAAQRHNDAKELEFELEGFRSTLAYMKEIDKASWINLF